jgi:hypothetical protein
MKNHKTVISTVIAAVMLLAVSGAAFAQTDASGAQGRGTGVPIDAQLDEYMLAALADELGVSLDSLTAQYEAGSTLSAIALANGVAADEVNNLLASVRAKAIDLAVADGALTADQAAWLKSAQYGANGRGNMAGSRGSGLTACDGSCDFSGAHQYQNPTGGASMSRGGRR